jgi:parallel beta-helix repeat protein
MTGFAVRHYKGNGVSAQGVDGVFLTDLVIDDTGLYGVYPVQSRNITITHCTATRIRDAAIYVGESQGALVAMNYVHHNVAGIEIENSFNADVTGNNCHDNTVGFLVFDLPALPQVGGHNIRVYANQFVNNNHPNFGDPSGTVAAVPAGTGGAVMANTKVEVFNNTFSGNTTAAFAAISCFTGVDPNLPGECTTGSPNYNPFPSFIHVHGNTFTNNGTAPLQHNTDMNHPSFALAYLLSTGFPPFSGPHLFPDAHVSEVLWDGVVALPGANLQICAQNNTADHFHSANLHLLEVDLQDPDLSQSMSFDDATFDCTPQGFPLPPVPVPTF